MNYTELQVTTNFSFLRGASHPDELVEQAADYGYSEIAITDCNSLAGLVRAHVAAKSKGIRIIPGCRLDLQDGVSMLAYPSDSDAYAQLSALLTVGNLRTEKGKCDLYKADVYQHCKGSRLIALPPALNGNLEFDDSLVQQVAEYKDIFGEQLYLAACRYYNGNDLKYLHQL